MKQKKQNQFNTAVGALDRILSQFILWSKDNKLDDANRKTLEHHAEDMAGAAAKVLLNLEDPKIPQSQCLHSDPDNSGVCVHCNLSDSYFGENA